jgi:chloride channel 3/4/5
MPTNEAYYSQPPSASTPRFRQAPLQPQGYGSTVSTPPSAGAHRRHFSIHSAAASPITKAKSGSPVGSIVRKIRKTASAVGLRLGGTQGNYDMEDADTGEGENEESMEEEDEAMKSNGMRVWYRYVAVNAKTNV